MGSTNLITNFDGEITQSVAYIPYGEVFVEERNGSWSTPYLFNAKELDEETGLYYYGARYLDPAGAMWLSVDPVLHEWASPYAYCLGNPIRLIDPDGQEEGNSLVLYHNTEAVKEIFNEGFNATKYGKNSNYNWFSVKPNASGTGRTNVGSTIGVDGIDVSKAHTITQSQTTEWKSAIKKDLGYTNKMLKNMCEEDLSKALNKIEGALYEKIGRYMDANKADVYYLEKDGTYAISDKAANKGTFVSINASNRVMKALNGLKVGARVLKIGAICADGYEIYTSTNKARTVTSVVGGWSGAYLGASLGGKAGGSIGTAVEPGGGTLIGGFIGSLIGGGIGYFVGREVTETIYDEVITPGFKIGK